jgi:hypothetical protein
MVAVAGTIHIEQKAPQARTHENGGFAFRVFATAAFRCRRWNVSPRPHGAPAARRFVWRVLALAIATAAFWLWRDPARAFADAGRDDEALWLADDAKPFARMRTPASSRCRCNAWPVRC